MNRFGRWTVGAFCVGIFAVALSAQAASITVLVGDKDGFGVGCPDIGSCPGAMSSPVIDNRSAAEASATDGSQFTDLYSALFPGFGPNPASGDVIFGFTGSLLSGVISFAIGDTQCSTFGALGASVNGNAEPFCFDDGRFVTAIHSITLSAAELAAANLAHQVVLHLDRGSSGDFISFDWFQLDARTVPEPGTLALVGLALAGFGFARRRS